MTTIREKIAATPKGMVLLRNGETITEAEYEKAKAERRREGAKVAAKSRARNKLFFQYSERFGWKYLNVTLTAAVMKKVEKSLATGIDLFAEVKSKTAEQEERERPERERREAKLVKTEMARRAAINKPLLAPITDEKEKAYTRLIKDRKLYEGACDLSWPEYFAFREEYVHFIEPLTDDDLAYAAQWTSCAVRTKTKPVPDDQRILTGDECESMLYGLLRLIQSPSADHPSELIELIDKAVSYVETIDDAEGCVTNHLQELIEAREDYNGPGIVR